VSFVWGHGAARDGSRILVPACYINTSLILSSSFIASPTQD
jgi:hypothetical protein